MNTSVAEQLPKELDRVKEVLKQYQSIGTAGILGTALIRNDLRIAEKAMADGDAAAMTIMLLSLRRIR